MSSFPSDQNLTSKPLLASEAQPSESGSQNIHPKKDIWDIISSLSVFIPGVLFAGVGAIFTYFHQESESRRNFELKNHEDKIAKIELFEKFLPHLKDPAEDVGTVFNGISSLDPQLGARILANFANSGNDRQKQFARSEIDRRSVQFLNTWSLDGVEQDKARFPAYLRGTKEEYRCLSYLRIDPVQKKQCARRKKTEFPIDRYFFISQITSYHYNNSCGSDGPRVTVLGPAGQWPATIALRDRNGLNYGPWNVRFYVEKSREDVDIMVDWIVEPNIILPPGTYEIVDNDPDTWSYNEYSKCTGISRVWGFAID